MNKMPFLRGLLLTSGLLASSRSIESQSATTRNPISQYLRRVPSASIPVPYNITKASSSSSSSSSSAPTTAILNTNDINNLPSNKNNENNKQRKALFFWKTCKGTSLQPEEGLNAGECLCNSNYNFCLDTFGTLSLLSDIMGEGYYIWEAPGTGYFGDNTPGDYAKMQRGGKLVVRTKENGTTTGSIWSSSNAGANATLDLSSQGAVTITSVGGDVGWTVYERGCKWTSPKEKNQVLEIGERLYRGQYICTRHYRFGVDEDGVVGIFYRGGGIFNEGDDDEFIVDDAYYNDYEDDWSHGVQNVVWNSGAKKPLWVEMEEAGNLAAFKRNSNRVWASTVGSPDNSMLKLLDSGELQIVDGDGEKWWWVGPFVEYD